MHAVARVGLISDTHGRLDPRAADALTGVDIILHAGDVCAEHVLMELEAIAPVLAVEGNCDAGTMSRLPVKVVRDIAGVRILVIHDLTALGPIPEDVDVVVCGHTHRPREEWHGGVLVLNPGSASQRRSMPYRSVGRLDILPDGLTFTLIPFG